MSVRVADRVEDWDQRSFDGGYAALQDLADAGFSGVVRAGGAELYMTAGTVVGIEHGTIEDFESATGTVYEAPDPSLPLLAIMQAANADVRAQYYTEETPISEVDGTLSDGGFTGFLELSENVLSGDYFLVYHGGRSMAVGYVGESERLISGDEAYETADDEVGIYKVRQVDVEPIELPEPEPEPDPAPAAEPAAEEDDDEPDDVEAPPAEPEPDADSTPADSPTAAEPADDGEEVSTDAEATTDSTASTPDAATRTAEPDAEAATAEPEPAAAESRESRADATSERPSAAGSADRSASTGGRAGGGGTGAAQASSSGTRSSGGGGQSRPAGQAGDLETRSIPSLDPDMTQVPEPPGGRQSTPPASASPDPAGEPARGREPQQPAAGGSPSPEPAEPAEPSPAPSGELSDLEAELRDREEEVDRLERELAAATEERDDLQAELEAAVEERDELAAEVERLEEELERLEQEFGAATDAERRMTPGEAVEGTNLFVDYDSKGDPTLEDAHDGAQSRAEVSENLQLGVHTEFDDRAVAVGGQDFDEFLRSTLHYRFAEWVVGTLLFEIRDTGHANALSDLYDAIPQIRRVEFNGAIDVEYVEDGQEKGGRERFDVIFRHRMGDPLVVANLNDARDPATGGMMETLVTSAERVGQTADSLAAAFLVTSSFFESEALETVSEATQGGILSRDKRKSFVNLSRKRGYHLCLVAAREGNFHMEVPEL